MAIETTYGITMQLYLITKEKKAMRMRVFKGFVYANTRFDKEPSTYIRKPHHVTVQVILYY